MPQGASEIGLRHFVLGEIVVGQSVVGQSVAPDDAHQAEEGVRSDLDARQDEILHFLDELNARIEAVIREFAPPAEAPQDAAPTRVFASPAPSTTRSAA